MTGGRSPTGPGLRPDGLSQSALSQAEPLVPNAGWQHVLEDGSFDHEWVTEFGITFCTHCELEKDWTE